MTIESHILAVIEGKKKAPTTKMLLRAMSHCYKAGLSLRHFAYDSLIPQTKLTVPIISVGNIVAGGTGKTPLVHYLAKRFGSKKVAILTRGYRRVGRGIVIVEPNFSVEECGDEPFLLAQKLPRAEVIVGADRCATGKLAVERGAEWVLLDDGMQYRRLHRDIEIGVMDAHNLFGGGYFLPRGLLRDDPHRLKATDLIVVNGIRDKAHFDQVKNRIAYYTDSPVVAMERVIENSTEVASKKVGMFCGIGAPERFKETLKTLGCDVVCESIHPDHVAFAPSELERLSNTALARGAECLVCTEKDAIKLVQVTCSLPIIPIKMALKQSFGKELLNDIIKRFIP